MSRRPVAALCIALCGALLAVPMTAARAAERIQVFAAASLKNAMDEIARGYSGAPPALVYGGSSRLARQIELGARAVLFVSADRAWMDYLAARGALEPGTRRDLVGNRLVLIAPRSSGVTLRIEPAMPLVGALHGGRLALGDPAHVPAGRYARAALEKLGVWSPLRGRLAPGENVRAALALVARGEAPLGIVYETDARADPAVRVVDRFDASLHPAIVYPMALVKGAGKEGRALAAYLQSPAAMRIFRAQGFAPLH
ncbi:MAG: molybdate ABC transporter substrate-binding protein [Betaproteobacteria bacterium]|nr:molybdate ABC transporter substrate-binding protein [Betaproteobacteria bacterium]